MLTLIIYKNKVTTENLKHNLITQQQIQYCENSKFIKNDGVVTGQFNFFLMMMRCGRIQPVLAHNMLRVAAVCAGFTFRAV